MATVYDVKTGEPLECESVDAVELIASGAYREEKDKPGRRPKPEKTESDAE